MKIQVRKCRLTGKIFEEKNLHKYRNHLLSIKKERSEERKHNIIRQNFREWITKEKADITSIDMVLPWLIENQKYIMDAHNAGIQDDGHKIVVIKKYYNKFVEEDEFKDLTLSLRYNTSVSNTHVCPYSGITNWEPSKNPEAPVGYPGWKGRMTGRLIRPHMMEHSYPYSEFLNLVGIKTGSGGGGNGSWAYEVSLFADDWPGLSEGLVFNKIAGVE